MSSQFSPILEYVHNTFNVVSGKKVNHSLFFSTVVSLLSVTLSEAIYPTILVWVPPTADPETRIWEQVIYLRSNSRKYHEEEKKWGKRKNQYKVVKSRLMLGTTGVQSYWDFWDHLKHQSCPPKQVINLHLSLLEGCFWEDSFSNNSSMTTWKLKISYNQMKPSGKEWFKCLR